MKNNFLSLILLILAVPYFASSQDSSTDEQHYGVHKVYPPISITKEKLYEASTLLDLNRLYKSSWIREYISVEISTTFQGRLRKAKSENDTLSQVQKDNMLKADLGTDISVIVKYMPENTLVHNDIKEMNFTIAIDPESDAEYPGGQQVLDQYLKENIINEMPDGIFRQHQLAAVKFSINEEGEIINPHVFWSSDDEKIDNLLLETIRKMPFWKPAAYTNGIKVKQEYVLAVGDLESCVTNLLNIHLD